jgi:3-deoxy-manno-octulosonate cytidylyltransferase (CMP-KDO synthetase)
MAKFIGIIPARYASTRFPGKPLAMLGGKTVIERVYSRVSAVLDDVVVATDDQRIFDAVLAFGGKAVMTSTEHRSGTDRCREAYANIGSDADVVINIQGDEPFIDPSQIEALKDCFNNDDTDIATLARKFNPEAGFEAIFDPNVVKVTFTNKGNAMYFSRSIIPYVRNHKWQEWINNAEFFTHVGIYAYRANVLSEISQIPQSSCELAESLEQLRWLQNGYTIKVAITNKPTIGIDTPADLDAAEKYLANLNNNA